MTTNRTFAQPSYTSARRVRIRNDRWYLVRFQNVETNPMTDYVGLGEGEYTQLLSGTEAREARDARLNHCNGIAEYDGPVFAVTPSQYGHPLSKPIHVTSADAAAKLTLEYRQKHNDWIVAVRQELERAYTRTDALAESIRADCQRCIAEYGDKYTAEVKRLR